MPSQRLFLLGLTVVVSLTGGLRGDELGAIPPQGFRSPEGDARFAPESGVRPLNNLVFELLNLDAPDSSPHQFRNPRDGWVYIKVTADRDSSRPIVVRLNETPCELRFVKGAFEGMYYRNSGTHEIQLDRDAGTARKLEVRAIGDLVYATFGTNPHLRETGTYSWEFLKRHCLDHYNGIIGSETLAPDGSLAQETEIREWTAQGKRWFTLESLPFDVTTDEECYQRWVNSLGMLHPLMSGIWVDEFGIGEKYGKKTAEMYPIWTEALKRLQANPAVKDRMYYSYIAASRLLPVESYAQMAPFLETMMERGYAFAPECYLPESRSRPGRILINTGDLIQEFSPAWEIASRQSFEHFVPGAASNRVITMFTCSEVGWETADIYPDYDFNVFLDAQFQFLATDPAYFGVRGIQSYNSGYTGEEQIRLFARLLRHYAIEGNTKRLLPQPYVLPHLKNPDFTEGLAEWKITPSNQNTADVSIEGRKLPGLGKLEARYHALPETGDSALWMRRGAERPNIVAQTVKSLTPGSLYSLRFITGNAREFDEGVSDRKKHAVSYRLDGVEVLPEKSFQAIVESGYWYPVGKFNAQNPYYLNYHQVVFRAQNETAELQLSDWISSDEPGGPAGEEQIWNFIQIQPYVE